MRLLIICFFTAFFSSCGARKVDLHTTSSIEERETHLQEQTKVVEIQWDRKNIVDLMCQLNVRGGEITIQPDGTIHAKGEQIDLNHKENAEETESFQQQEKNKILALDESLKKAEEDKSKHIERKQYIWWLGLPLLLAIVILITLLTSKKWRSKLKSIFRRTGTN